MNRTNLVCASASRKEDGTVDTVNIIFLVFAITSLAVSLTFAYGFIFGSGKKGSPYTLLVGFGFALLAGCFVWLWMV